MVQAEGLNCCSISSAVFFLLRLVETHIFSFVVGRAFVTDIEKFKLSSKTRALEAEKVLEFFSEITKDGFRPGANLLHAVEILVSGSVDNQSFLDSGILSCLIHVLNALIAPDGGNHSKEPVGVLEVLLDDLKQHKFQLGPEQFSDNHGQLEIEASSSSFQKHLDTKDAISSSPKLFESGSGKIPPFDMEEIVSVAWDCLVSLLKKAKANQAPFCSANGFVIALPFIVSDIHRPGVLRLLSCLIMEDVKQVHSDELGSLVEILKSGMVTSALGSQYTLQYDAKCDAFGALWRILGVNGSAQRVFGEVTGFSLLLTTLHSFQSDEEQNKELTNSVGSKIFTYMMRAMTVAVSDNAVNRTMLSG
ncbi:protein SPIRRIG-like isoform X2 [Andrographis paniculata]|uniref:protein SPIRRIG-like isoform X2 n=1 Tax=Andrographis paniculata TaxID=175694 RepID=UPI0021E92E1F|nr:protein SPIRRIG-like isoform X2 [Andrographis paniculata]